MTASELMEIQTDKVLVLTPSTPPISMHEIYTSNVFQFPKICHHRPEKSIRFWRSSESFSRKKRAPKSTLVGEEEQEAAPAAR